MKKILIFSLFVIVIISGCSKIHPKACTEEAKICPDGSAVGRTGPNCEFTPCLD
jgi:PBP1b-binding outer membrane lipoprotein LpoB